MSDCYCKDGHVCIPCENKQHPPTDRDLLQRAAEALTLVRKRARGGDLETWEKVYDALSAIEARLEETA